MRVLIVQGHPDLGALWARHLSRIGAEVEVATNQEDAVAALSRRSIDIIVMSLTLPKGSALAVADYASYRRPSAQIIFVTNSRFFSDGSIFQHFSNARAMMPEDMRPEDLAAMIEHYAAN